MVPFTCISFLLSFCLSTFSHALGRFALCQAPELLYKSLAAKLVVGMPFKVNI